MFLDITSWSLKIVETGDQTGKRNTLRVLGMLQRNDIIN